MRWSVYKVDKLGGMKMLSGLGYVNASTQPAAVRAAEKRWPKEADWSQPNASFSVRQYATDKLSLGKLNP